MPHTNRIHSLDGLRACSIALVLVAHANTGSPVERLGELGVMVFFVISGFLITTLLQREWEETGGIDLGAFYFRRTTRIVPAYLVYLGVIALTGAAAEGRWWPALTYTSNIFGTHAWATTHSWSLSVEEQFYCTWPLAFARLGPRRARRVALGALLVCPLIRLALIALLHNGAVAALWNHDFIAGGCLLALTERRAPASSWAWIPAAVGVTLYALLADSTRWTFVVYLSVVEPILVLGTVVTVAWCLTHRTRLLNSRPLVLIGALSYSLYLWQQAFLGPSRAMPVLLATIFAGGMAVLSYQFVEQPVLALRRHLLERIPVRSV